MHHLRTVLGVALIASIAISSTTHASSIPDTCNPQTVIASAYYSPSQDQRFWMRESFEREVILQGQGIAGASGRAVFDGMIATPSTYQFGQQIIIPDRGIGEVHDRGGAIVQAGERGYEHDRIDIWMGHGEVGLIRALIRGKRTIDIYVCDSDTYEEDKIGFDLSSLSANTGFFTTSLRTMALQYGREDVRVYNLQQLLIDTGYLDRSRPTGYLGDETTAAICDFQLDKNVVGPDSQWCGTRGPLTRSAFFSHLRQLNMLDPTLRTPTSIESIIATVQNKAEDTLIASTTPVPVKKPVDIITVTPSILPSTEIALDQQLIDAPFAIGSSSFAIIDLQKDLTASGYYASDITGIYDEITHQAWLASRQTKK